MKKGVYGVFKLLNISYKEKMNRRYEYKRKESKIKELIISHLENNMKEYAIISIIFFIALTI